MECKERLLFLKDGRTARLRHARPEDASMLLELLRTTSAESRFLLREPEEVTMTVEEEEAFITARLEAPGQVLLTIEMEGHLVGMGSLSGVGPFQRYAHRGGVALALRQSVWGQGLGRQLLTALLDIAKTAGYEQVELDVLADNHRARSLYESVGFTVTGTLPRNMKYKDGTYADAYFMVREL